MGDATWVSLERRLYAADRAAGRAGYRRQWPMLRKACEAAALRPGDLERPGCFEDLADAQGWSERTRVVLRKVAGYAGIHLSREPTPEPDDIEPATAFALRRPPQPDASPSELRNTFVAALVWQWPAKADRVLGLTIDDVAASGEDLLVRSAGVDERCLPGLAAPYTRWLDARAAVGVDDAQALLCVLPSPVVAGQGQAGRMLSPRGLQKSWATHSKLRAGRVVPYDSYRRAAIADGAKPVDRGLKRGQRLQSTAA